MRNFSSSILAVLLLVTEPLLSDEESELKLFGYYSETENFSIQYLNLTKGYSIQEGMDYETLFYICSKVYEFECLILGSTIFAVPKKIDTAWRFFGYEFSIVQKRTVQGVDFYVIRGVIDHKAETDGIGGFQSTVTYQYSAIDGLLAFQNTYIYEDGSSYNGVYWFEGAALKPSQLDTDGYKVPVLNADQLKFGFSSNSTLGSIIQLYDRY